MQQTSAAQNLSTNRLDTKKLVTMAMLSAIGVVLGILFEIPILPVAPHLLYDPADIPILIGTLAYGPIPGVLMTFVVAAIQSLAKGSGGIIGFIMHFVSTGAMAFVAGALYHRRKQLGNMIVALALAVLTMTVLMVFMNLWLTPYFLKDMPLETARQMVRGLIVPATIPFNLIKAGLNCLLAGILFKSLQKVLKF